MDVANESDAEADDELSVHNLQSRGSSSSNSRSSGTEAPVLNSFSLQKSNQQTPVELILRESVGNVKEFFGKQRTTSNKIFLLTKESSQWCLYEKGVNEEHSSISLESISGLVEMLPADLAVENINNVVKENIRNIIQTACSSQTQEVIQRTVLK